VQQHDSIDGFAIELCAKQAHSTTCEAGGTQIEPDGSIAPHAATLHSVAHSQISFRLIAKISQAKLANSRGVDWHAD